MIASSQSLSGIGAVLVNIIETMLVPAIFAVTFIAFVWGAFETFIVGSHSEETKEKGKNLMLWGLMGFFTLLVVWILLSLLVPTGGTQSL